MGLSLGPSDLGLDHGKPERLGDRKIPHGVGEESGGIHALLA